MSTGMIVSLEPHTRKKVKIGQGLKVNKIGQVIRSRKYSEIVAIAVENEKVNEENKRRVVVKLVK